MDEKDLIQEEYNEVQTNEESTQASPENSGAIAAPTKDQLEERNFARLREKALRAERERDEALRLVREMDAQKQKPVEEEVGINLGDDEIAEGKHLKNVARELRELKNELKKYKQESATTTVETKIRSNYPDFDSVVSRDNLESLRNSYPELAQTLLTSNDEYSRAASAYTLIKKLGIDSSGSYEMDKQKVQQNAAKPKPLASLTAQQTAGGALANANAFAGGLTKDLQAQLLKEMQESRKGF